MDNNEEICNEQLTVLARAISQGGSARRMIELRNLYRSWEMQLYQAQKASRNACSGGN